MINLIGICGLARHGKDTIANILVAEYGFHKRAYADRLKEIALAIDPYVEISLKTQPSTEDKARVTMDWIRLTSLVAEVGWDEAKKHPDVRRLLQRLGTEAGRELIDENIWLDLRAKASRGHSKQVVPDVRFPNEDEDIHHRGGILIRVHDPRKQDNGVGTTHASEQFVEKLAHDYYIENNGTIADLRKKVIEVMDIEGFIQELYQSNDEDEQ